MDRIVEQVGKKNNCEWTPSSFLQSPTIESRSRLRLILGTFCGVFRRQALDRGAAQLGVDHIVTGHNADDIAETVLMNSQYKAKLNPLRG
jgi:cytoplasmic tRNA 2-thiolation protein 1